MTDTTVLLLGIVLGLTLPYILALLDIFLREWLSVAIAVVFVALAGEWRGE